MLFLNTVQLYILFFVHQIDSYIDIKPRIVEGHQCTVDKHPYYVTILNVASIPCGGTLVTLQWIISAAHCFASWFPDYSEFHVRAGFDENLISPNIQIRSISNVTIHPKYNGQFVMNSPVLNDIAVARLTEPFDRSKVVDTVLLPREGFVKGCSEVVALGVGYNHNVTMSRMFVDNTRPLQCVTLKLVKRDVCQKSWRGARVIDDSVICTQQPGQKSPCYGDSGGPLMCGHRTIVGIISSGYGCGMRNANVYANVEAFLPFIHKVVYPNYKIPGMRSNKNPDKEKSSNSAGIFITSINPMLIIPFIIYICYNILE